MRDQNSSTYLHLLCYFVYQNTSNNALPFQSWTSVCNSLSTHEKKIILFLNQIYLIICIYTRNMYLVAQKRRLKTATYPHSDLVMILPWLAWNNVIYYKIYLMNAGTDASCRRGSIFQIETSNIYKHRRTSAIKQPSKHLLFSIGLIRQVLNVSVCACVYDSEGRPAVFLGQRCSLNVAERHFWWPAYGCA